MSDGLIIGGGVALVAALAIGGAVVTINSRDTISPCTVQSKDRTAKAEGGSDARIYTEQCGVLSVEDSLLAGQFDSADIYASIKVGATYTFETQGWRVGLLSWFPNVIKATEVPK